MNSRRHHLQRPLHRLLPLDLREIHIVVVLMVKELLHIHLVRRVWNVPSKKHVASRKFRTGITHNPSTTAASAAFSTGTITLARPSVRARNAIADTPFTGRTAPFNANSPDITKFSSCPVSIWKRRIYNMASKVLLDVSITLDKSIDTYYLVKFRRYR